MDTQKKVQSIKPKEASGLQKFKIGLTGFEPKHFLLIGLYGMANIFRAASVLISGPFFPPQAFEKGTSGTEIGLIFASQDITVFIMSLVYGKKMMLLIGPQKVINIAFFAIGVTTMLFGCTVLIENHILFVIVAMLTRIMTGMFDAGIYPSFFTLFSIQTPNSISTAIAIFEVFFGIGAMAGPILAGLLLEQVGFTLTYVVVGSGIVLSAILIFLFAPKVQDKSTELMEDITSVSVTSSEPKIHHPGFLKLLSIPSVLLVIFSLSTASASIGYISATLSLHYNDLTPRMSGALFSVATAVYTLACPIWGYVADHKFISKTTIMISGAILIGIGFSFLGPLPFLPVEKTTWAGFVGLAIHGIGIGGSIMTAYHHALKAAIREGFPDTSRTYGLVSSVYIATFSAGNAIGPTVSGVLFDLVQFRWGSMFIIVLAILVLQLLHNKRPVPSGKAQILSILGAKREHMGSNSN